MHGIFVQSFIIFFRLARQHARQVIRIFTPVVRGLLQLSLRIYNPSKFKFNASLVASDLALPLLGTQVAGNVANAGSSF